MNLATRMMLLVLAATLSYAKGTQSGQQAFSLALSIPNDSPVVKAGQELIVQITLTNTSVSQLEVAKTNGELGAEIYYVIDVRDEKGKPAPETPYGHKVRAKETGLIWSSTTVSLEPRGTLKDTAVVTKLYDLRRPGYYFVQVSRQVTKNLGGGVVKSNVVRVTVSR